MKIFIHERKGSFSDRWISYCKQKNIKFEILDCFDSNIISRLNDGDVLLWHWDQTSGVSLTFARYVVFALEAKHVKVFPDIKTCWHYDDKVAQKYLLEAIGAPLIPSYVFYDRS